jgi:hypothetical protein
VCTSLAGGPLQARLFTANHEDRGPAHWDVFEGQVSVGDEANDGRAAGPSIDKEGGERADTAEPGVFDRAGRGSEGRGSEGSRGVLSEDDGGAGDPHGAPDHGAEVLGVDDAIEGERQELRVIEQSVARGALSTRTPWSAAKRPRAARRGFGSCSMRTKPSWEPCTAIASRTGF